jgi:hypothetical protein
MELRCRRPSKDGRQQGWQGGQELGVILEKGGKKKKAGSRETNTRKSDFSLSF